jgi:hypothetical protein
MRMPNKTVTAVLSMHVNTKNIGVPNKFDLTGTLQEDRCIIPPLHTPKLNHNGYRLFNNGFSGPRH